MVGRAAAPRIAEQVALVRSRVGAACERAGRAQGSVTLIAVSKTQPASAMLEAAAAGIADFGENYAQEAIPKLERLQVAGAPDLAMHFIGHLQTNKARVVTERFDLLHTVDSERLLDAITAARGGRRIRLMLQVNTSGEATRGGVDPSALGQLVRYARSLSEIEVVGLMTIPAPSNDPEQNRPAFRCLRELAQTHGLAGLSMGMTDDFEVAIEEGATHVRVGRAIFGERY